ncbi:MAG: hypothetical protein NVS4B12_24800 [Ktedonobacteraceae bacterium]
MMGGFPPASTHGYQPETFVQFPKKKRARVGLIITIVVLLLAIVGGGTFAYLYLKKAPGTTISQTTPNAVATLAPTGNALFKDTFTDNKNGWDTSSKDGQFSVKIGGGSLLLEDDNHRLLWDAVPNNKPFSDFFLTVDASLSKGDQGNGYGIYIRGALNQNAEIATYYRFELYGDGTFAIFKGTVDAVGASKNNVLVDYTNSSAILKQGQVNHISVNAKGSTMIFTVNGQILKTVIDNTYTTGTIALFVSNLANTPPGAQATFANLSIYPPQS